MKKILIGFTTLMLSLFVVTGVASAHNADASATCSAGVTWHEDSYENVANTVTVKYDGVVVVGYPRTFHTESLTVTVLNPDKTKGHTWEVVVDQANGTQYDHDYKGSIDACQSPTTTTLPPTTLPATTVPATTLPATTVPSTTIPATTVPVTTVPITTVVVTTTPVATIPVTPEQQVSVECNQIDINFWDYTGNNTVVVTVDGVSDTEHFNGSFSQNYAITKPEDGFSIKVNPGTDGFEWSQKPIQGCETTTTVALTPPPTSVLPATGGKATPIAWTAAAFLVAGIALLIVRKERHVD